VRTVGVVLVFLGALGLVWQGCEQPLIGRSVSTAGRQQVFWVPPLVSGIAMVTGLILLASAGRRDLT
jgi:hypothetical protein